MPRRPGPASASQRRPVPCAATAPAAGLVWCRRLRARTPLPPTRPHPPHPHTPTPPTHPPPTTPTPTTQPSIHPQRLPLHRWSVLRHLEADVEGVSSPMLYIGALECVCGRNLLGGGALGSYQAWLPPGRPPEPCPTGPPPASPRHAVFFLCLARGGPPPALHQLSAPRRGQNLVSARRTAWRCGGAGGHGGSASNRPRHPSLPRQVRRPRPRRRRLRGRRQGQRVREGGGGQPRGGRGRPGTRRRAPAGAGAAALPQLTDSCCLSSCLRPLDTASRPRAPLSRRCPTW